MSAIPIVVTSDANSYTITDCVNITLYHRMYFSYSSSQATKYRIKIIPKYNIGRFITAKQLDDELRIVQNVKHANINNFVEKFDDEDNYYLVFEKFSYTSLLDLFIIKQNFDEIRLHTIMNQLLSLISFLHQKGIALRCLRPEYILIDNRDKIALTDFSFATFTDSSSTLNDFYGGTVYSPPEMLAHEEYFGFMVDVWTIGVLFYQMITLNVPWVSTSDAELCREMRERLLSKADNMTVSQYDLLSKMLDANVARRFSLQQVMHHFWIQNSISYENHKTFTLLKSNPPSNIGSPNTVIRSLTASHIGDSPKTISVNNPKNDLLRRNSKFRHLKSPTFKNKQSHSPPVFKSEPHIRQPTVVCSASLSQLLAITGD